MNKTQLVPAVFPLISPHSISPCSLLPCTPDSFSCCLIIIIITVVLLMMMRPLRPADGVWRGRANALPFDEDHYPISLLSYSILFFQLILFSFSLSLFFSSSLIKITRNLHPDSLLPCAVNNCWATSKTYDYLPLRSLSLLPALFAM